MSGGSILLEMLKSRASIQTDGEDQSSKAAKEASQNSEHFRKCIKNFNFKLDYSEIDRIIEEEQEEGGGAGQNNNNGGATV